MEDIEQRRNPASGGAEWIGRSQLAREVGSGVTLNLRQSYLSGQRLRDGILDSATAQTWLVVQP